MKITKNNTESIIIYSNSNIDLIILYIHIIDKCEIFTHSFEAILEMLNYEGNKKGN